MRYPEKILSLANILHMNEIETTATLKENVMKISNEQLRIMQENELRKAQKQGKLGGEFGDILARQLEQAQVPAAQAGASLMPVQSAVQLQLMERAAVIGILSSNEAVTRMDGMFASFERYAEQIARSETGSLREAYGLLQEVSGQIAGFRAAFPDAEEAMPELALLLNELDVLRTTETFKLNRGDYL